MEAQSSGVLCPTINRFLDCPSCEIQGPDRISHLVDENKSTKNIPRPSRRARNRRHGIPQQSTRVEWVSLPSLVAFPAAALPFTPFFARDGHEGELKTTPQNTKLTPPVVSLDTLTPQQLTAVKKQLDEEVEHLSGSYSQLAAAQAKFKECLRVVQSGSAGFDSSFTTPLLGPSSPCMHDR